MKRRLNTQNIFVWSLLAVLPLSFSTAFAENALTKFMNLHEVQLAYIQTAKAADLVPVNAQGTLYKLTLNNVQPSVYYFSDRPNRVTGSVKLKDFLDYWQSSSKNSFKSDLPNASLVAEPSDSAQSYESVFEISQPSYNIKTHSLTYLAKPLKTKGNPHPKVNHFSNVSLFIDNFSGFCLNC